MKKLLPIALLTLLAAAAAPPTNPVQQVRQFR